MNITDGPALSFSGTDLEKAELFRFFVYYSGSGEPRAIEVMMHWCVNTYTVTIQDNVPVTNLASEITNALLDLNHTGLAWRDETYVHVRWPWLTLLVAQVGLSVLTFVLVVAQTAGLNIEIVKGSSLPALLAVKAEYKVSLITEQRDGSKTVRKRPRPLHLQATGITGAFQRSGRGWTLQN
ncbi:hypothetical protein CSOJ01_08466 [Colletotrichum sojae]|uniref:Uncharacterized protein n=1 Tax=Colletotrichum sojae TaxID=2175907 RepID=A0A8H6J5W4_9PEZI|nr:hypothetical protein CSOJ01_08466 [Colletotrichum sojae]